MLRFWKISEKLCSMTFEIHIYGKNIPQKFLIQSVGKKSFEKFGFEVILFVTFYIS